MAQKEARINITARDKTGAQIKQAQKSLMQLKTVALGVSSAMVGIGGIASVGGLTMLANRAIQTASRLDDVSKKLGVGTEFLQAFGFAARETGIRTEAAEMGLQRFIRRVGEAQQGLGELRGVLSQYNIQLKNADGTQRGVTEIMRDYADVIKSVEDPQERLRLAFKAFDSEGAGLVTMMSNGSAGLDEWIGKAKEAGQVMEDPLIKELAAAENALERFNMQLTVMAGGAIVTIKNQLEEAMPLLRELAKMRTMLGDNLGDMKYGPGVWAAKKLAGMNKEPGFEFAATSSGNQLGGSTPVDLGTVTKTVTASTGDDAWRIAHQANTEAKAFIASLGSMTAGTTELSMANFNLSDDLRRVAVGFDTVTYSGNEAAKSISKWETDAANAVTTLAMGIEDGLVNAAMQGKSAFADMGQFILAEIQRILIRTMILRPLFEMIGGGFTGAGYGALGSAFAGAFGGGKASGGSVSPGKSYLVGEKGPELLTMGGAGNVTPNNQLGGGPVFNVDMRGASVEAVQRLEGLVMRVNGSIEKRAVAAVSDAHARRPSYLSR